MEREAQARLLTGAGILAALGALIFFFKKRGGGHTGRQHEGSITVLANGMDVHYSPETFTNVSRSRRDVVLWRLENLSDRRVEVCVTRFRNEDTGGHEDPLEDIDQCGKCRRLRGGGRGTIPTKVRRSASIGTYKYSIFVDGREAEDPRLAIVD